MKNIFKNEEIRKYILIGSCLVFLYWALNNYKLLGGIISHIFAILMPFIIGMVIAFIINVPMKQVENKLLCKTGLRNDKYKGLRRALAYFITLLLVLILITVAMFIVIPQLVETIGLLFKEIPIGVNRLSQFLMQQLSAFPEIEQKVQSFMIDWDGLLKNVIDFVSTGTKGLISGGIGAVNGIISGVTSFFIGFVFSVYILFQKEKLSAQFTNVLYALCSQKKADKVLEIARITNITFSNFLSGQCLEAVILGTMFVVTMSILRLPYALLIGVLIAVTALIPIVGAFIGCAVGILLIALASPIKAVVFVILFFVLQQIEGNLIYPHVVGNSVGLPGIWVLVAVTVGGNLFGIAGMLTFIPICSVLYSLFRIFIERKLKEKNLEYHN